jgi:hypothetical protein
MGSRDLGYQHFLLGTRAINGPKADSFLLILYPVAECFNRLLLVVLNGTRLSILCFFYLGDWWRSMSCQSGGYRKKGVIPLQRTVRNTKLYEVQHGGLSEIT